MQQIGFPQNSLARIYLDSPRKLSTTPESNGNYCNYLFLVQL